mgnify:FL=1
MKAKRSAFNLIEITLAIAVVGIGVAAVMALLVPALNASKDSLADTYTADVVNTFMTYVRGELTRDWNNISNFNNKDEDEDEDEVATDDMLKLDNAIYWQLGNPLITGTGIYDCKDTKSPDPKPDDSVYKPIKEECANSVFRIKVDPDFTAHMRIWYEELNNSDKNPNQFNKDGTPESLTKDDGIVRFYFELSWPATIPYAARKKSLYVTEFYNRNLEAKRCY